MGILFEVLRIADMFVCTVSDCAACDTVSLSSQSLHHNFSGDYTILEQLSGGLPVFSHMSCQVYLHFVKTHETQFWIIGPETGVASGYVMSYDDVDHPAKVVRWKTYDFITGTWMDDDTARATCKCGGEIS